MFFREKRGAPLGVVPLQTETRDENIIDENRKKIENHKKKLEITNLAYTHFLIMTESQFILANQMNASEQNSATFNKPKNRCSGHERTGPL